MLKPQYLNLLNSSFLLFLNNHILSKGLGYTTGVSSYYYPIGQVYYSGVNLYTYASPYQPQVFDSSITPVMSGCYLSGSFITVGQSGLVDINRDKNQLYFSNYVGNYTKISGVFPLNEINILPLQISEQKLLFETKFALRNRTTVSLTGIPGDSVVYPSIYIKESQSNNVPYELGGTDETISEIGVFLFCENAYQLSALRSILTDAKNELFGVLTEDKMPFNVLGGYRNPAINYNYTTTTSGYKYYSGVNINDVVVNSFINRAINKDFMSLNPNVHLAVADFSLSRIRMSRQGKI